LPRFRCSNETLAIGSIHHARILDDTGSLQHCLRVGIGGDGLEVTERIANESTAAGSCASCLPPLSDNTNATASKMTDGVPAS
jgi:hypothetical protein